MCDVIKCKDPAKRSQHAKHFHGHSVAMRCDMLGAAGSLENGKFEPTTPNTSQQDGQTHNMLRYVGLACCDRLAGA